MFDEILFQEYAERLLESGMDEDSVDNVMADLKDEGLFDVDTDDLLVMEDEDENWFQ